LVVNFAYADELRIQSAIEGTHSYLCYVVDCASEIVHHQAVVITAIIGHTQLVIALVEFCDPISALIPFACPK